LKIFVADDLKTEIHPDTKQYPGLAHPPFIADISGLPLDPWGDLKIEGYIGDKLAITKTYSGKGIDALLHLEPDDVELEGDGIDATRLVLRVTDEHGGPRQFASGALSLSLEGPGELVGENPYSLVGGVGAVWIKSKEAAGTITVSARHAVLGTKSISIKVRGVAPERV
jgi:beta-galactosidase